MASTLLPQPGDLCLVHGYSHVSRDIRLAEYILEHRKSPWNHVCMCSRIKPDGTIMIVEAEPHGAVEVPFHYEAYQHAWSTGILPACPNAGEAALAYVGTEYGFEDYGAILLYRLHIRPSGLVEFMEDTDTLICSQLVTQARSDAGCPLFKNDPAGNVMPSDIGFLYT